MTRHLYVGLTGYAGAGKDYVCQWLREHSSKAVHRVAFADGVRMEIQETLLPSPEGSLPALWDKPYPETIRRLLQWWGTDLRRAQDPDYWVAHGMARASELDDYLTSESLIVFTDVRFENEAAAIKDAGGIVFQVMADEGVRAERLGGSLPPAHASEEIDYAPLIDAGIGNFGGALTVDAFPPFTRKALGLE